VKFIKYKYVNDYNTKTGNGKADGIYDVMDNLLNITDYRLKPVAAD